jgi:hypothetical protein
LSVRFSIAECGLVLNDADVLSSCDWTQLSSRRFPGELLKLTLFPSATKRATR